MEEKKKRISELTELLNRAAYAYEQEDREIMSNLEYDRLYDELKILEEETGIVMANSPTARAGYEVLSELPKVRHDSPMLSLDKTKEPEYPFLPPSRLLPNRVSSSFFLSHPPLFSLYFPSLFFTIAIPSDGIFLSPMPSSAADAFVDSPISRFNSESSFSVRLR